MKKNLQKFVPFAAAALIEAELKWLWLQGVIKPISYSQYAAPLVIVKKKDGHIRICVDYSTGLNDALEPHQHPLATPKEIFAKLSQFHIFSVIDLTRFWFTSETYDLIRTRSAQDDSGTSGHSTTASVSRRCHLVRKIFAQIERFARPTRCSSL